MSRSAAESIRESGVASSRLIRQTAAQTKSMHGLVERFQVVTATLTDRANEDRTRFYQQLLDMQGRLDSAAMARKLGLSEFPMSPEQYVSELVKQTRMMLSCTREQAIAVILQQATNTQVKHDRGKPDPE